MAAENIRIDIQSVGASASFNEIEEQNDVPVQVCNTARSKNEQRSEGDVRELYPLPEEVPLDQSSKCWDLNYREAAIFLEEGLNNEKFTTHPRCRESLPVYLLVHNKWYYILDFFAALLLVCLAFVEKPANPLFRLSVGVHSSIELFALAIIGTELVMKLRWLGFRVFVSHPRSMVKAVTLVIMVVEAIFVLVRQSSHFRVTRAIRPIFLVDNYYCGSVRRYLRQVLQSVPPALDILSLLLFVMLFYSVLGFYLFSDNPSDPYFTTLQQSFISLFVLLTTANYPDVMMPSYDSNRWSAAFFVSYISIVLYFLMNLMLAAVYASFTAMEKKKFRQLLLHRRVAAQHAFRLLLSRKIPENVSFEHFKGLMRHADSTKSYHDVFLMFRYLNTSGTNLLSLEEFYNIYDVLNMKWTARPMEQHWFSLQDGGIFRRFVTKSAALSFQLVTWKVFDYIVCAVILLSGVLMLVRTSVISQHVSNPLEQGTTWESCVFVLFYTMEAALKIFALGGDRYFSSGWNLFDFIVTVASLAGLVAETLGHWPLLVVVRHVRIVRLFKLRKRYRDVFGTVFILGQRLWGAAVVFMIFYYAFAIVGMELFAEHDLTNCCKNSSVELNFAYFGPDQPGQNGYYYLNNFENLASSYVTLFELTVVNNWYIIMEGYAVTVSQWCRIYFMLFYLVTMLLLSIVVASVLDGFLFRISYKQQMSKEDEKRLVEKDVHLTSAEAEILRKATQIESNLRTKPYIKRMLEKFQAPRSNPLREAEPSGSSLIFRGSRRRTKDVLLSFMYKDEIIHWLSEAEQQERQR